MFYDTLTTAAVSDELSKDVVGGWVQKVLHLSEHSLGLEIYANHVRTWLLISAHPQHARVNLVPEKLARDSEDVSPLLLLMRKHIRNSRLAEVIQPPLERLLILTFVSRAGASESGAETFRLIIEIMGRHSNVVLLDGEGLVMESLRRVPAGVNRFRVVLPRHPYSPPPAQQKMAPQLLAVGLLRDALLAEQAARPAWQVLVANVAGMSPLLAREIAYRCTGDSQILAGTAAAVAGELLATTLDLYGPLTTGRWAPCVIRQQQGIVAFAPYTLTHLGKADPVESISAAVEAYYGDLQRFTAGEQAKEQVRRQVGEMRSRHLKRKDALERSLERGAEAERLRRCGEAIFASVGAITDGQARLEFDGSTVDLDPRLSLAANAQKYFRAYKKAKAALAQVPSMLAEEQAALAYLEEVAAQLELAGTVDEVRRVAYDLAPLLDSSAKAREESARQESKHAKKANNGKKVKNKGIATPPKPFRVLVGGYEIFVGRSARQNEELTFHLASPDDLWLHARKTPGAHVVVKAAGRAVPEHVIEAAAALAAAYSQARHSSLVAVDFTARKHVRRIRQGLPGLVSYSEEQTISVAPDRTALLASAERTQI